MPTYLTRQRKLLYEYLCEHADETLSASQITEALGKSGVSQSAVYRNLSALEQEGKIRRSLKVGSTEACYRYMDAEPCRGHLHLSCVGCGRVVHMDNEEMQRLSDSLSKTDGFKLSCSQTVLYGLCSECSAKNDEGSEKV